MNNRKTLRNRLRLLKNTKSAYRKFGVTSIKAKIRCFLPIRRLYYELGWEPYEYFQFEAEGKTSEELNSYICKKEHGFMVRFFNKQDDIAFLQDKWKTYGRYGQFFHRQVLWSLNESNESLQSFFESHDRVILKPVDGTFGIGVKVVQCSDYSQQIQKLYDEYPNGVLIEELIQQDNVIGDMHKESVNTIRIYSITDGDEVVVFHPWLRIGRGHNVIDNASAGGVGAAIDFETGIIQTARDKRGHTFDRHPDTDQTIIGVQIPQWNELKEMVREMALVNPQLHYVGWDVALSTDGWVLVEGNPRAQIGFQIMERKGFRSHLESILTLFNLKEDYYKSMSLVTD